jgi:hypothetical protein
MGIQIQKCREESTCSHPIIVAILATGKVWGHFSMANSPVWSVWELKNYEILYIQIPGMSVTPNDLFLNNLDCLHY